MEPGARWKEQTSRRNPLGSAGLLLWQGCDPQVWLDDLEVWEHLLRFLVVDAWVDNHVITRNPVDGSSDLVLVASLQ